MEIVSKTEKILKVEIMVKNQTSNDIVFTHYPLLSVACLTAKISNIDIFGIILIRKFYKYN